MTYRKKPKIDKSYSTNSPPKFHRQPMETWHEGRQTAVCQCCYTSRALDEFPNVPDSTWGYIRVGTERHVPSPRSVYCMYCLNKIGDYFAAQEGMDKYKALYRICAMTNVYYCDSLAHDVVNDRCPTFTDGTPAPNNMHWVDKYLRAVHQRAELKNLVFYKSDNFIFEEVLKYQRDDIKLPIVQSQAAITEPEIVEQPEQEKILKKKDKEDSIPEQHDAVMGEHDRQNRAALLAVYHYDPFENEDPRDASRMMEDLVTMIDDSMADDLVRQRAAAEIVKTFNRIDKIGDAIRALQSSPESIAENSRQIKELIDTKKKETDMVTAFSKDHGFAEKYAISKSKGAGTLSAVIRDMKDFNYDRGQPNKYDIETSACIQQVSDISAESIFKQIAFTESEYSEMIREQSETIYDQNKKIARLQEEIRLLKEKGLKQELMEELKVDLRRKGISDEDISAAMEQEVYGGLDGGS